MSVHLHLMCSAALGCPACSLAVPGFLKPAVVGRVSGWVLVGLKLPVTPGNPRLKVGDAGGSGASVPAQQHSPPAVSDRIR